MENGVISVYTGLSGFLNPVMSEKDNPPRLDRVERLADALAPTDELLMTKDRCMRIRPYAPMMTVVALALAAPLAGCGDRVLDAGPVNYMFGGGPPADAPSPVRGLGDEVRPYPNLATVPPRPTNLPTQAQIDADMERLSQARGRNRAAGDALQAIPGAPTPLAVPPPPNLTPGRGG